MYHSCKISEKLLLKWRYRVVFFFWHRYVYIYIYIIHNHFSYPYIMEIFSHFVREFIQPIYMVKRSLTPHWNQNGVPCVIKYLIFWYTENLPAQGQKRGARFFIFKYDLVRDFFWYVNYSAKTDMENHYTSVGEWKWYWPLVLVPVGSNPGASNKCLNVLFIAITKKLWIFVYDFSS